MPAGNRPTTQADKNFKTKEAQRKQGEKDEQKRASESIHSLNAKVSHRSSRERTQAMSPASFSTCCR